MPEIYQKEPVMPDDLYYKKFLRVCILRTKYIFVYYILYYTPPYFFYSVLFTVYIYIIIYIFIYTLHILFHFLSSMDGDVIDGDNNDEEGELSNVLPFKSTINV